MNFIILIGLQASGKSSFFKQNFCDSHIRINLDMLKTRRKEECLVKTCLEISQPFVVDNTNPGMMDRKKYFEWAKGYQTKITGYYFQSSITDCLERNRNRIGQVPDVALKATHKKIELPQYQEGFDELYFVYMDRIGGFVVKEWMAEEN